MSSELRQDLRYALRSLGAHPRFATALILTLGLAIGANTVIFSVMDGVLLRPLNYPNPEELVQIWDVNRLAPEVKDRLAPADFLDLKARNSSFEEIAAYYTTGVNLWSETEPERIVLGVASPSYLPLLGAAPVLGRAFEASDQEWGEHRVALLSHRTWLRRYGSNRDVLGREIVLNGSTFTIIGVLPEDFKFYGPDATGEEPAVWRPLAFQTPWLERDGARWLYVMGRLDSGVALKTAQADLDSVTRRLEAEYPTTNTNRTLQAVPLREELVGEYRSALVLLFSAVVFVLLISCANVSNLLLARTRIRRREFSIRVALGADRRRLILQLLSESTMISLLAGSVGVLFALWGLGAVTAAYGETIPRLREVGLDVRILGFTVGLSLLTALLFGLAPAIVGTRVSFAETLKEAASGPGGTGRRGGMRGLLVVVEVSIVTVLLIGAGLLIRSFHSLQRTEPGFDVDNVLTANLVLPRVGYEEPGPQVRFVDRLTERLGSLHGVAAVGVTSYLPLSETNASRDFYVEGRPLPKPGEIPQAGRRLVSPGYFRAMGIPLLRGRVFTPRDRPDEPAIAVLNQTLADQVWPDEDPIGKRLSLEEPGSGEWLTVVGVVGDVRHLGLDKAPQPEIYRPFAQQPWFAISLVLRTVEPPLSYVDAVRREVLLIDSKLPVFGVQTLREHLHHSLSKQRFSFLLLTSLGLIGLFLATSGVYALMSYLVTDRTHDIAIHLAMGARKEDIMSLVVREGMLLVTVGILAGGALAVGLKPVVSAFLVEVLYGVEPGDPLTVASVLAVLAVSALLATVVPARRAMRLDPAIALRVE